MPNLRGFEWILLILLLIVLFGAKRLPDAARGLGRSLRIFKAETKGLHDDDADPATTTVQQVAPAAIPPAPPSSGAIPGTTATATPEPVERTAPATAPPADPGSAADR